MLQAQPKSFSHFLYRRRCRPWPAGSPGSSSAQRLNRLNSPEEEVMTYGFVRAWRSTSALWETWVTGVGQQAQVELRRKPLRAFTVGCRDFWGSTSRKTKRGNRWTLSCCCVGSYEAWLSFLLLTLKVHLLLSLRSKTPAVSFLKSSLRAWKKKSKQKKLHLLFTWIWQEAKFDVITKMQDVNMLLCGAERWTRQW